MGFRSPVFLLEEDPKENVSQGHKCYVLSLETSHIFDILVKKQPNFISS